jgi:predicted ATPase
MSNLNTMNNAIAARELQKQTRMAQQQHAQNQQAQNQPHVHGDPLLGLLAEQRRTNQLLEHLIALMSPAQRPPQPGWAPPEHPSAPASPTG